jgi:surface protein
MKHLFAQYTKFNQDIGKWDVGNVTNMNGMFLLAINFNQDINKWNVGNVTNMSSMFFDAHNFNQNISKWDVGKVKSMKFMFYNAFNFNQNISKWDVGKVKSMKFMFYNAFNFNQNISTWSIDNHTNVKSMMNGTMLQEVIYSTKQRCDIIFNKTIMNKIFAFDRRKSFMHFLIENGFEPLNNKLLLENEHMIFDTHDINYLIMSYL